MAYIYKITNDINNKIYIGKTEFSIEKRFQEHCRDAFKERNEKRPLYAAIRKYGIEHFHIEEIEQTQQPEEREKYWIEQYGSFKYGYNATLGGDGTRYADYDLIFALWQEGLNNKTICEKLHYDTKTVTAALQNFNITKEQRQQRGRENIIKPILMLDKNTEEILQVFSSMESAFKYLNKQSSGHIAAVCKGKRKTAYGYKWKYAE